MQVTFQGGTPQQHSWVNEAISLCSYPLDKLPGLVITVNWSDGFPSNADTRHPYMVTVPQVDGSFLITIATWADDARNPNNQGLPNPVADIKDFYMQSFVHELGHVVIDSTFNPGGFDDDARVQRCCGLFWKAQVDSGAGRRLGAIADWGASGKDWPDMIREAAAEVFKCGFFTGRLVFSNRTRWNIDESNWANYLALISNDTPHNEPITFYDDFSADTRANYVVPDIVGNGNVNGPIDFVVAGGHLTVLSSTPGVLGNLFAARMPLLWEFGFDWTSTVKVLSMPLGNVFGVGFGDLSPLGDVWGTPRAASNNGPVVGGGDPPIWCRLRSNIAGSQFFTEFWDHDPETGGVPSNTNEWANIMSPVEAVPVLDFGISAGPIVLDDWRVHTFKALPLIEASAPYPFGNQKGYLKPGPAAQGLIRIGG